MKDLSLLTSTELFELAGKIQRDRDRIQHSVRLELDTYRLYQKYFGRSLEVESSIFDIGKQCEDKNLLLSDVRREMFDRLHKARTDVVYYPGATFCFVASGVGCELLECCDVADLDRHIPVDHDVLFDSQIKSF